MAEFGAAFRARAFAVPRPEPPATTLPDSTLGAVPEAANGPLAADRDRRCALYGTGGRARPRRAAARTGFSCFYGSRCRRGGLPSAASAKTCARPPVTSLLAALAAASGLVRIGWPGRQPLEPPRRRCRRISQTRSAGRLRRTASSNVSAASVGRFGSLPIWTRQRGIRPRRANEWEWWRKRELAERRPNHNGRHTAFERKRFISWAGFLG